MATRLKDGRWQARLLLPDGSRKPFYGATEAEAEARKAAWDPDEEAPSSTVSTVHEFVDLIWWPGVETTKAYHTQRKYKADYRNHIYPFVADLPIESFDHRIAQKIVNKMVKDGKGANTIRHVAMLGSTFGNLAVHLGYVTKNPFAKVQLPPKPEKRHKIMRPKQVLDLFRATAGTPMCAACVLACIGGMREGEVSAAQWSKLNRGSGTFLIDVQAIYIRREGIEIKPVKQRRRRTLMLSSDLVDLLDRVGNLDAKWLVADPGGAQITPAAIGRRWEHIRKRCDLEDWHFHDLRHASAALLHMVETDPFTIRDILGHKSVEQTWEYTSVAEETQRNALDKVVKAVLKTN